jgi:hypothetical protein
MGVFTVKCQSVQEDINYQTGATEYLYCERDATSDDGFCATHQREVDYRKAIINARAPQS